MKVALETIAGIAVWLFLGLPWYFAIAKRESRIFRILLTLGAWVFGMLYVYAVGLYSVRQEPDEDWRFHIWETCWLYMYLLTFLSLPAMLVSIFRKATSHDVAS